MKWIVLVGLCLMEGVWEGEGEVTWWDRHAASISCQAPGYFVNPVDCRSFYRCVDRSTWDKPSLQRYDFSCPPGQVFDQAVSVCTKPGPNGCADPWWPPGSGGGGGGGGGSSVGTGANGGSGAGVGGGSDNGIDLDELPPIFSSSRGPGSSRPGGGGSGGNNAGFNRPSVGFGGGGGGGDPLEAEFGTPSDSGKPPGSSEDPGSSNSGGSSGSDGGSDGDLGGDIDLDLGFNKPSSSAGAGAEVSFGGSRPRPSAGFGFGVGGGGGGGDPLDAEFGTPSGGGGGGSGSLEDLNPTSDSGSKENNDIRKCLPSNCKPEGGSTTFRPSTPNWFNRPRPGGGGSSNWDRNDGPGLDLNFDTNNNLGLGGGSTTTNRRRPSSSGASANANWGGASRPPRPGFGDGFGNPYSPWRPTGPWGASSNSPISPGDNPRPGSWWDPPFAFPYHPPTPAPPPPPEPFANPFRPRYPAYQIVAYPTWPGPYDRNPPIIVVYSNSKKKK